MKRLAVAGFALWLAATIALRFAGQWIFHAGIGPGVAVLLTISGVLMWRLPRGIFAAMRVAREDYAVGAIALVAPEAAGLFGGWLLLCNIIALLSAASAGRGHDPDGPSVELRHG